MGSHVARVLVSGMRDAERYGGRCVRDVAAHLAHLAEVSQWTMLGGMVRWADWYQRDRPGMLTGHKSLSPGGSMRCLHRRVLALVVVSVVAVAGCGGDDDDDAAEPATTTQGTVADSTTTVPAEAACPSAEEPLRIVLVNDDGVINPAIDAMVDVLGEQEGVELTIIAPAEERSGSSDQTTPGGATYQEATTPGGNAAYSVNGFPADAVAVALDDLALDPHLFVSGVNPGQNVGPLAAISGTVGVGRTAVRRDYPRSR